ncbi:uncharacterized protein LOC143270230 [Peromyscus maniculatus bairdii]|uniref:uncharacterized protein LOC143270230 n=1 Tax=Peromyscus maniculatus bairdii TaxID=230844 RepID=UPI003FD48B0F
MRAGGGLCVHPAPGRRGERWSSVAFPPRRDAGATRPRGPRLSGSGSQRQVTRLLCLPSELKVQEVFRNEVTGSEFLRGYSCSRWTIIWDSWGSLDSPQFSSPGSFAVSLSRNSFSRATATGAARETAAAFEASATESKAGSQVAPDNSCSSCSISISISSRIHLVLV